MEHASSTLVTLVHFRHFQNLEPYLSKMSRMDTNVGGLWVVGKNKGL
jgi:hypothetical protein